MQVEIVDETEPIGAHREEERRRQQRRARLQHKHVLIKHLERTRVIPVTSNQFAQYKLRANLKCKRECACVCARVCMGMRDEMQVCVMAQRGYTPVQTSLLGDDAAVTNPQARKLLRHQHLQLKGMLDELLQEAGGHSRANAGRQRQQLHTMG